MTNESIPSGMQSWLNQFTNAVPGRFDWTKSVAESVRRLAESSDPAEALAAQSKLVQKSVASYVENGQSIAAAISNSASPPS